MGVEEEEESEEEEDTEGDLNDAKEDLIEAICALHKVTKQDDKNASRFDDQVKRIKEL